MGEKGRNNDGEKKIGDDESRKEYDYMLDHPEEMFGNYYR